MRERRSSSSQPTAQGELALACREAPSGARRGDLEGPLPERVLGRTGVKVSPLGLGMGPLGLAGYGPLEVRAVVEAALAEFGGRVLVDTSPGYGEAERYLAPLLADFRDRIFVTTKICEETRDRMLAAIEESRRRLGVETIDAVLLNNAGMFDLARIVASDGALAGLNEARERGMTRYVGLSGHTRPDRLAEAVETGSFDLAMVVVNFADRHTYDFEGLVLPVAKKWNAGVVAMKVLGGAVGSDYGSREQRGLLIGDDYKPALHYALDVSGVTVAVIGCKSIDEVKAAAEAARCYRPLSPEALARLLARGREVAAQWGRHFDFPADS